jgi:chaperonin GroES
MNVKPLHDRIIVRRLDEGEQKIGGIIIPDSAKEKPQQLFGKYSGQDIKIDDEDYLIVKEDEVLAVIDTDATHQEKKS